MKTISHSWIPAHSHIPQNIATKKHDKPLPTEGFQHALGFRKITHLENKENH